MIFVEKFSNVAKTNFLAWQNKPRENDAVIFG